MLITISWQRTDPASVRARRQFNGGHLTDFTITLSQYLQLSSK